MRISDCGLKADASVFAFRIPHSEICNRQIRRWQIPKLGKLSFICAAQQFVEAAN
jgi:hypothetical protein